MVSEAADFYAPTLSLKDLSPYNKERKGLRPKMQHSTLDELVHIFQKLRPYDVDGR